MSPQPNSSTTTWFTTAAAVLLLILGIVVLITYTELWYAWGPPLITGALCLTIGVIVLRRKRRK